MNTDLRLTYRSKQTDTAWQKKIRDEKRDNFDGYRFWEDIDLSLKNAIVKPVSRSVAEKIIYEYEWLGDMAVTDTYYGIFFGAYCGGVICISSWGGSRDGNLQFGLKRGELSYFARGACPFWTPTGTASKLLSMALRLEGKRGMKAALAFADTDAGEYGTVYQACNWYCIGRSGVGPQWVKNDRVLDNRTMCGFAKRSNMTSTAYAKMLESNGWRKQKTNAKYKYAYIIATGEEGKRIKEYIKDRIVPYPKRPVASEA